MEKILNIFREMGFEMEDLGSLGYGFKYEGVNFLFMPSEDDKDFLSIAVPGLVDSEDVPEAVISALIEKVNSTLKYVKAYTLGDALWLFYERELFEEEDLEPIIARMILHLDAATYFVRRALSAGENNDEDYDEDNEVVDDDYAEICEETETDKED